MRLGPRREPRPDLTVAAGERLLAWAVTTTGEPVGGTRDALYLLDGVRVAWEQVAAADWDAETDGLRVSEVGSWGEPRPTYDVVLGEPGRFLELVRERVTASIVLTRHTALVGRRGVRVVARRAPSGHGAMSWVYEFDEGIDPTDPFVRQTAEEALIAAREEVGER